MRQLTVARWQERRKKWHATKVPGRMRFMVSTLTPKPQEHLFLFHQLLMWPTHKEGNCLNLHSYLWVICGCCCCSYDLVCPHLYEVLSDFLTMQAHFWEIYFHCWWMFEAGQTVETGLPFQYNVSFSCGTVVICERSQCVLFKYWEYPSFSCNRWTLPLKLLETDRTSL